MIRHLECSNDEAVVRALGVPRKSILHHAGSGSVAKALQKASERCIGMVDEDPRGSVPSYFSSFSELERGDGLVLKEHRKCGHRLIVVMPDLEPWLQEVSKACKVPPGDFQLPAAANRLHQIGDTQRIRFGEWIQCMLGEQARGIMRLKQWLG
jgi:hypothetical protein